MSAATIRAFRETDLDGAVAANVAVGWAPRLALVEFYGRRDDSALFVAEVEGKIAGCGGATVFPGTPATGWVHCIVVRPEHRRAGLGRWLTEAAIEWLRGRSAATVLLLATDAGRPIYQRLGFTAGERYGSFSSPTAGGAVGAEIRPMTTDDLPEVRALDRAATGEDRAGFIESLVTSGWVTTRAGAIDAFHLACPWGGGPSVARDVVSGCEMIDLARRLPPASSRGLGLPLANAAAVKHLAGLGVTAGSSVTRMWLGTPPSWRPDMIFGVFNFGVG